MGLFRSEHGVGVPLDFDTQAGHNCVVVNAKELYLFEHGHVHSASVATSEAVNIENLLFDGLAEEVCRSCPDEHANSMIWLLWHAARSEDVGINLVLCDERQVFDDRWATAMNVTTADIGTGMRTEDVVSMSQAADIDAVREYRVAVGRRTRDAISSLDFSSLGAVVEPDRLERVMREGCLRESAAWVLDFWRPQRRLFFLWLGTGHNYMHLQEAAVTRSRAGAGLGL